MLTESEREFIDCIKGTLATRDHHGVKRDLIAIIDRLTSAPDKETSSDTNTWVTSAYGGGDAKSSAGGAGCVSKEIWPCRKCGFDRPFTNNNTASGGSFGWGCSDKECPQHVATDKEAEEMQPGIVPSGREWFSPAEPPTPETPEGEIADLIQFAETRRSFETTVVGSEIWGKIIDRLRAPRASVDRAALKERLQECAVGTRTVDQTRDAILALLKAQS